MKISQLAILIMMCILLFFVMMFFLMQKTSLGPEKVEAHILYSSPQNNSTNVPIDKKIIIYFNAPVKDISIETNPIFPFSILKKESTIEIEPKEFLQKNANYKIEITSKAIKNSPFEINFKTGEEIETALKQDAVLLLKIKGKIPVYSSYFDMTYIEEEDYFAIMINSKDCEAAKKSALTYLKKNNINPKEIKIKWYQAKGGNASCTEIK